MVFKILCVAEKPSIAKAVANHLAPGAIQVFSVPGKPWLKNYVFDFTFNPPWNHCQVTFTAVAGHLMSQDFNKERWGWQKCEPMALFDAPIETMVIDDNKPIGDNIRTQARHCSILYIWTDCDREGEAIGAEVRKVALGVKPGMQVKRARFSNTERAHIIQAAMNPVDLDDRQVDAVAARSELDLRVGSIFTRFQTNLIRPMVKHLLQDPKAVISFGTCQLPTLGFIVDRYFRVKNFVPETFWKIQVIHVRDDIKVSFNWKRVHLFDRMIVTILFERCINARTAKVTKVQTKPTSKWKPLPLTTVELQKCGSRFLRLNSHTIMALAEMLYQKGFISYPRTETDQFDRGMDLRRMIEKQTSDHAWGTYAQGLLNDAFSPPRDGRNNDQAHPPIHPVNHAGDDAGLDGNERRVYEFVVRRFLACCSEDAKGSTSTVELAYGPETFTASGLTVLERNYLDVYPYDKWTSSQQLPNFTVGETFVPTEAKMSEGKTSPPRYLTEPELIGLMDANGVGTDATMADHIKKIFEREYYKVQMRGRAPAAEGGEDGDTEEAPPATRGGRGGRGRGRGGRGGANVAARGGGGGVEEFIPTTLGVALIQGYDEMGFDTSLSKPFLRKEMELQMKAICEGHRTRNDVVQSTLEQYRDVYIRTNAQIGKLRSVRFAH